MSSGSRRNKTILSQRLKKKQSKIRSIRRSSKASEGELNSMLDSFQVKKLKNDKNGVHWDLKKRKNGTKNNNGELSKAFNTSHNGSFDSNCTSRLQDIEALKSNRDAKWKKTKREKMRMTVEEFSHLEKEVFFEKEVDGVMKVYRKRIIPKKFIKHSKEASASVNDGNLGQGDVDNDSIMNGVIPSLNKKGGIRSSRGSRMGERRGSARSKAFDLRSEILGSGSHRSILKRKPKKKRKGLKKVNQTKESIQLSPYRDPDLSFSVQNSPRNRRAGGTRKKLPYVHTENSFGFKKLLKNKKKTARQNHNRSMSRISNMKNSVVSSPIKMSKTRLPALNAKLNKGKAERSRNSVLSKKKNNRLKKNKQKPSKKSATAKKYDAFSAKKPPNLLQKKFHNRSQPQGIKLKKPKKEKITKPVKKIPVSTKKPYKENNYSDFINKDAKKNISAFQKRDDTTKEVKEAKDGQTSFEFNAGGMHSGFSKVNQMGSKVKNSSNQRFKKPKTGKSSKSRVRKKPVKPLKSMKRGASPPKKVSLQKGRSQSKKSPSKRRPLAKKAKPMSKADLLAKAKKVEQFGLENDDGDDPFLNKNPTDLNHPSDRPEEDFRPHFATKYKPNAILDDPFNFIPVAKGGRRDDLSASNMSFYSNLGKTFDKNEEERINDVIREKNIELKLKRNQVKPKLANNSTEKKGLKEKSMSVPSFKVKRDLEMESLRLELDDNDNVFTTYHPIMKKVRYIVNKQLIDAKGRKKANQFDLLIKKHGKKGGKNASRRRGYGSVKRKNPSVNKSKRKVRFNGAKGKAGGRRAGKSKGKGKRRGF